MGIANNSPAKPLKLPDLIEGGIKIEGPPDTVSNIKPPASINGMLQTSTNMKLDQSKNSLINTLNSSMPPPYPVPPPGPP
jgi:hypothetical protein